MQEQDHSVYVFCENDRVYPKNVTGFVLFLSETLVSNGAMNKWFSADNSWFVVNSMANQHLCKTLNSSYGQYECTGWVG